MIVGNGVFTRVICAAAVLGWPASALAQRQDAAVSIALAEDSQEEGRARDQLLRILSTWDLSRWLFTQEARIDSRAIPHSHPVLTVNTRYLGNDTAQIATFIHEQLHWFMLTHRTATDSAVVDLESLFPDAPEGPPEGARDRYSTYLHLMVCLLEYDALVSLFGEDVAERTVRAWRHYPWVYRQVLERAAPIRRTLARHGLNDPDARALE